MSLGLALLAYRIGNSFDVSKSVCDLVIIYFLQYSADAVLLSYTPGFIIYFESYNESYRKVPLLPSYEFLTL